jgi:hypothetical protein
MRRQHPGGREHLAPVNRRDEVTMATPGFPPHTLDASGAPVWISGLAGDDPNHTVHVVRGLAPAAALEVLGARPETFRECALPQDKPDRWMSLPAAALGLEPEDGCLLAGSIADWTFVYDDLAYTSHDDTPPLSAAGRTAATSMFSVNADASLTYAVDGEPLAWISADDLDLAADLPTLPAELRAAFEAAGTVAHDYLPEGAVDYDICMRAVCALAGLRCTLEDLRGMPLVLAPFA